MQLGVGWGLLCMTTRVCVFTVSVWNKSVLYAVQLTRALEEDEFAVEHHLVYRLDQVDSSMASTAHDGVGNIYAQPFSPLVLWGQNHPADLSVLPSIALSIVQYCIACRLSNFCSAVFCLLQVVMKTGCCVNLLLDAGFCVPSYLFWYTQNFGRSNRKDSSLKWPVVSSATLKNTLSLMWTYDPCARELLYATCTIFFYWHWH